MTTPPPRWHVLGAGSIGSLFAARLDAAGIPVTLLLRPAALAAYRKAGALCIEGPGDARVVVSPPATEVTPAAASPTGRAACVLACTKAPDTEDALAPVIAGDGEGQLVLLLQNGMGVAARLRARWPRLRLWCGVTTAGAWRASACHVVCVANGETHAGPFDGNGDATLDSTVLALADAGVLVTEHDIRARLWRKLAVNAVINALTALHRCRNGELLTIPDARASLAPLAAEVEAVARAEGIVFDEPVLMIAESVIRLTAENHSSMNRDVAAGRRTEIDFINGYVVDAAKRHGIDVPRNAALVAAIHALEASG